MDDTLERDLIEGRIELLEMAVRLSGSSNTGGLADLFFDIKEARDEIAAMDKRLKNLLDEVEGKIRSKAEAEGWESFKHARGSLSVKEENQFSVNPECWEEIPAEFRQKRILTNVIKERIEHGDEQVMDWVARGVVRITPVKEVSFRRSGAKE